MKSRRPGRLLALTIGALLAMPLGSYAQEATIGGTITDTTGGVLPGVALVAVHTDTGNTFETVSDGTGRYSVPVRIGGYTVTAALPGFNTLERTGIQIQVGQTVNMDLEMEVSTLQETVTVTGEAPLLDVASSDLGGNIDAQQMQELPVSGRGWTTLALLAPGNRTNSIGAAPVQDSRHDNREYQLNMDGQQVTNNLGTGSQSRFNRDSIAEFQFISNRFDAAQGRSSGVQVNAISKSGTNAFTGLASGYFRRDRFNAEDHVLEQVQPIDISQYSFTSGGPLVRDRVHFFGNFEYEKEPKTSIWNTPYDVFNTTLTGDRNVKLGGARIDYQITSNLRLMMKGNASLALSPFGNGSSRSAPTSAAENKEETKAYMASLTQVISNRAFNEIKAGFANYKHGDIPRTTWSNHWQAPFGITRGSPRVFFRGFSVSGNSNHPRFREQDTYFIRDDFTFSYDAGGRHDVKVGGEYLLDDSVTNNCSRCMGRIFARGASLPSGFGNAEMAAIFPDFTNADTWNLDLIPGNTIQRYQIGVTSVPGVWLVPHNMHKTGLWVQDDWHVSDNMTLNLGLRYDLLWNAFAQQAELEPWQAAGRPQDTNNIQPRLGFAYQADENTVIRGGGGIYYSDVILAGLLWPSQPELISVIQFPYDGRADFASNPFNGPFPTYAEIDADFCHNNGGAAGCRERAAPELAPPPGLDGITQKIQTSIGFQRQLGSDVSIEADYVYSHGLNEKLIFDNINVKFNEAGEPFGFRNDRLNPLWESIGMYPMRGWSNYHGLQTAFRKRLSNRWQASATYTMSWYRTGDPKPLSGLQEVGVAVPDDIGDSYSLGPTDQRHRVVFNSIVDVGGGFQLSGLYFFGSGERDDITCGCEFWDRASNQAFSDRRRENGTIIQRASFVGEQLHRVDIRLSQRLPLDRVQIDGILEMFNVFNRANFGSFETEEEAREAIGTPQQSRNIAYQPFTMQLGFRVAF